MKVLITGATGFIGAHLCHRLVSEGHSVVALVRDPAMADALPKTNVELLAGDLSIFEREDLSLPGCDAVVHLAGVVAAERVSDYHAVNFLAVKHLVACLERQAWRPKRLLFASSMAAAGPSATGALKSEADACAPVEPYGQSKLDAEVFLQSAPFPTTSFRPALVFGEGDPATITLFRMAKRGFGFGVAGTNPGLSFIDIEDLLDAMMKLLADASALHRTFFVSYPTPTDNRTLWATLGRAMQRKVVLLPVPRAMLYVLMVVMTALSKVFRFKNQLDVKQYQQITAPAFVCSSAALERELDWKPKHDLEACISKTAEGFRKSGWL